MPRVGTFSPNLIFVSRVRARLSLSLCALGVGDGAQQLAPPPGQGQQNQPLATLPAPKSRPAVPAVVPDTSPECQGHSSESQETGPPALLSFPSSPSCPTSLEEPSASPSPALPLEAPPRGLTGWIQGDLDIRQVLIGEEEGHLLV